MSWVSLGFAAVLYAVWVYRAHQHRASELEVVELMQVKRVWPAICQCCVGNGCICWPTCPSEGRLGKYEEV